MHSKQEQEKKNKPNPYANNRGGRIIAPHTAEEEPRATIQTGKDLRVGK